MPSLNELNLGTEKIGADVNFADMPEQMGGQFRDNPQPGTYRFRLPADLTKVWDTMDVPERGTRLTAIFDESNPLVIVQSPGSTLNGEPFTTRISNIERRRGKKDDPNAVEVSEMDYLLRDGLGIAKKPTTNKAYAEALIGARGQEFTADIEWSYYCNDKKDIRVEGTGNTSVVVEGTKGCGKRYYQKDIEKVHANPDDPSSPLVLPSRITCSCGAVVRGFANLARFRK